MRLTLLFSLLILLVACQTSPKSSNALGDYADETCGVMALEGFQWLVTPKALKYSKLQSGKSYAAKQQIYKNSKVLVEASRLDHQFSVSITRLSDAKPIALMLTEGKNPVQLVSSEADLQVLCNTNQNLIPYENPR